MSVRGILGRLPGQGPVRRVARGLRRGATWTLKPVVEPLVDEAVRERVHSPQPHAAPPGSEASEAASRKAEELQVDLATVQGTGADGMVTVRDVVRSRHRSEQAE